MTEETFGRTNLGWLRLGDAHLERPIRYGERLGGHLVQGHVDAVGVVESSTPRLRIGLPRRSGLRRYVVERRAR